MAVHARPAAFDGVDGYSYSVDILVDQTGDASAPYGGYLLFVKWGHGEPQVAGHLETDFLVRGASESTVRHQIGVMPLAIVKATLDGLIRTANRTEIRTEIRTADSSNARPWWEVAATESDDDDHTPAPKPHADATDE